MNVLHLGAFALSLVGTPDGQNAEGEWLGLDQEIQNLATSLNTAEGVDVSGFLRVRFVNTNDFTSGGFSEGIGSPGMDISGFYVSEARLRLTGTVGDYGFKIEEEFGPEDGDSVNSFDLDDATLKEAYAWWNCGENLTVQFGQFKIPFSRGFLTNREEMAFLDRPFFNELRGALGNLGLGYGYGYYSGLFGSGRDTGIQLSGDMDMFDWAVALQNGLDGVFDEYRITGRATVDVIGEGVAAHQGGYGIGDETALNIGLGISDDGALNDGDMITIDARLNANPITADVAIFDFGNDLGDITPWNVSIGYMFTPDEWEANLRYEDLDDDVDDTTILTLNLTWYMGSPTHKWQFEWLTVDSDDTSVDGDILQAGLTVGYH